MFSSLVPAMLNLMIGNDGSCVASTIAAANAWMATYGPVGSNVAASSLAWTVGEPLHRQLDNSRPPHRNGESTDRPPDGHQGWRHNL